MKFKKIRSSADSTSCDMLGVIHKVTNCKKMFYAFNPIVHYKTRNVKYNKYLHR